ncbi:anti-sigma-D factor RsdA-like protein [Actinomycetospora succinea]|uniref:Anti-sigma-D factor RsdA-like protein n=1 Tax=Actinomycetospora succinea TaxID=663603 RepID=A0A4R6UM86_9PSEU|nr:anti-sigma-D factor RsdA [Actinomycetospora succinea]TDQ47812.1 anti-sigma-D factor RsdA-like protein [Actinomycetospora succinea]
MGGHRASGGSEGDLVDGPVDLAAVRADDALIDALAGGAGAAGDTGAYGFGGTDDDRLAAILAAWRADIEADPMPELVTLDEAAEAVTAGHESRDRLRSRGRRRMPFAIAAVAAAVACAGLTVAVHGAMPGDTLWGVSKVFFSERAQGVERVEEVRNRIEAANGALARGDTQTARNELAQANVAIPQVAPEQRAPLVAERDRVQTSIESDPSPSTREPSSGSSPRSSEPSSGAAQQPEDATTPSPAEPAAPPAEDPASPEPQTVDPSTRGTEDPPGSTPTPSGMSSSPGSTSSTTG